MKYSNFYKTYGHSYEEYEKSHKERFDFLIEDLKLNDLKDKKIADVGCGLGFIYNRLSQDIQSNYFGYDGANFPSPPFNYKQADLDNFSIPEKHGFFDVVFCFETIEHLTNPYNCFLEIKNILKKDGILFLSIPHIRTEHNTIYPGLIYPVNNFISFLGQMAFEIMSHTVHDKSFYQEVFVLKNKDWNHSHMLWRKTEEKFQNIPPHISINL
jgi:2-polyprenyl-3-methyl-5-hydroxy-6-metoxy-1,4-benzoquinol methylase